jgi:transmembrane sensor
MPTVVSPAVRLEPAAELPTVESPVDADIGVPEEIAAVVELPVVEASPAVEELAAVAASSVPDTASIPSIPARRAAANTQQRASVWSRGAWRIAAAIVVLLGGAMIWRKLPGPRPAASAVTVATAVGQTDTTYLADGTQVILGPDSRLVVAAMYGQENRSVELTGEALFEVQHGTVPFTVSAGGALMEDLGTTFDVRAVGGEVVVAVSEGSVRMSGSGANGAPSAGSSGGIVLKAGDRASMAAGAGPILQQGAATQADVAWVNGELVFDAAPVSRVVADVRRWYGVEVQVPDSALAASHLTLTFGGGEPVEEVLDGIGLALGAQITRNGNVALLHAGAGTPN